MRTCVIIPTYNESKAIGEIVRKIRALDLRTIIIDDGSVDDTVKIAEANGAQVLRNPVNQGKGSSLVKGYNYALAEGFDTVISVDGDGQHSCEDIPVFLKKAESSNFAIIVGNRMDITKQMPFLRIMVNRFMSGLISMITGQHIPDSQCGFRLVKKDLLEKVNLSTSKYETESEILIQASQLGFKIGYVPIKTIYSGQKSQINPFIDTLRFLRFIIIHAFRKPKKA